MIFLDWEKVNKMENGRGIYEEKKNWIEMDLF